MSGSVISVTEFKTKILAAFVQERNVFFSDSREPCEECLYKLLIKNCKISLLRKLVSKKIGL